MTGFPISQVPHELKLVIGSLTPGEIVLYGDRDQPLDLDDADMATFSVRDGLSSTTNILLFDTGVVLSNLVIDKNLGVLRFTPSAAQWTGAVPGAYIGQAAIRFGDDDNWKKTEPFVAVLRPSIAPTAEAV